jgi:hypothetical protein
MRQAVLLAGTICLLAGTIGCDTQQPLQVDEQELVLNFTAGDATVPVFWVWEQYWDADEDGVPDEYDQYGRPINPPIQVWCQRATNSQGQPLVSSPNSIPWQYTLQISKIPAGETRPIALTSEDAYGTSPYLNLTLYDEDVGFGQPLPSSCRNDPDDVIVCNPLGTLTSGARVVIESTFDLEDAVDPSGAFYCPGEPGLGDPTLGGTYELPEPPPFRVILKKGDTIIVEARKSGAAANAIEVLTQPALYAEILLNGRPVTPIGETESTTDAGDGLSFSFTTR